jgi:hypothetical protein
VDGATDHGDGPLELSFDNPREIMETWQKVMRPFIGKKSELCFKPECGIYKMAEAESKKRLLLRSASSNKALSAALLAQGTSTDVLLLGASSAAADVPALPPGSETPELSSTALVDEIGRVGADGTALVTTESFQKAVEIGKGVAKGAVATIGALKRNESALTNAPDRRQKRQQRGLEMSPLDVMWMMVTSYNENHSATVGNDTGAEDRHILSPSGQLVMPVVKKKEDAFPNKHDKKLVEWYEAGGGKLEKVGLPPAPGEPDYEKYWKKYRGASSGVGDEEVVAGAESRWGARRLVAKEKVNAGDVVLNVPIKLSVSQLSARNTKDNRKGHGYMGDRRHLRDAFKHNQEWALAALLLQQIYSDASGVGNSSKWGPYIKTMRLRLLGKAVLRELQGTYAAELYRTWDDEAKVAMGWIQSEICSKHIADFCKRDPSRPGSQRLNRDDMRWALQVVRTNTLRCRKVTTGRTFLAMVPLGELLKHRRGAGGNCTLHLDNTIRISVGQDVEPGGALYYDRGAMTDAEEFLRWHALDAGGNDAAAGSTGSSGGAAANPLALASAARASAHRHHFEGFGFASQAGADGEGVGGPGQGPENPYNAVRLRLPGDARSWQGQKLWFQLDVIRQWREEALLPPRASDLWKAADKLHLYGEEDEANYYNEVKKNFEHLGLNAEHEDERSGMRELTAQEALMLTGQARSPEQAEMILRGVDPNVQQNDDQYGRGSQYAKEQGFGLDLEWDGEKDMRHGNAIGEAWSRGRGLQLYSPPDVEDDPEAAEATTDLAHMAEQLLRAVAANPQDAAAGVNEGDTERLMLESGDEGNNPQGEQDVKGKEKIFGAGAKEAAEELKEETQEEKEAREKARRLKNAANATLSLNSCKHPKNKMKPCINGSVWPPRAVSGVGAIGRVINETVDFFYHGVKPGAALDAVDLLLLRKMRLLEQCHGENRSEGGADGPGHFVHTKEYRISRESVTTDLLCAVRVHLANETEMDALCPQLWGPLAWSVLECEGGAFDWRAPISRRNEYLTLGALEHSMRALLADYTTTMEHDESLLLLDDAARTAGGGAGGGGGGGGGGARTRAGYEDENVLPRIIRDAVRVRLWEKRLLEGSLSVVGRFQQVWMAEQGHGEDGEAKAGATAMLVWEREWEQELSKRSKHSAGLRVWAKPGKLMTFKILAGGSGTCSKRVPQAPPYQAGQTAVPPLRWNVDHKLAEQEACLNWPRVPDDIADAAAAACTFGDQSECRRQQEQEAVLKEQRDRLETKGFFIDGGGRNIHSSLGHTFALEVEELLADAEKRGNNEMFGGEHHLLRSERMSKAEFLLRLDFFDSASGLHVFSVGATNEMRQALDKGGQTAAEAVIKRRSVKQWWLACKDAYASNRSTTNPERIKKGRLKKGGHAGGIGSGFLLFAHEEVVWRNARILRKKMTCASGDADCNFGDAAAQQQSVPDAELELVTVTGARLGDTATWWVDKASTTSIYSKKGGKAKINIRHRVPVPVHGFAVRLSTIAAHPPDSPYQLEALERRLLAEVTRQEAAARRRAEAVRWGRRLRAMAAQPIQLIEMGVNLDPGPNCNCRYC